MPLNVKDLFMVGRQTKIKRDEMNINTMGDLAKADRKFLYGRRKSFGNLVWCYANGIDESPVHSGYYLQMKSIGNSTNIKFDVTESQTAYKVLLSLTESVSLRLRNARVCCRVVSVEIRTAELNFYSHQRKLV